MKKRNLLALILSLAILSALGLGVVMAATGTNLAPSADKIYLSDLKYKSYKIEGNYKPWYDDDTTGNGKINLSDQLTFDKGVRTHPGVNYDAEVVYDLKGLNAYRFCSYIGKDANGKTGNTQFKVYVDKELKYTSPIMAWGDYEFISIDVLGASTLRIVQNDGGDGYSYDGGSWGDAALYCVKTEGAIAITAPDTECVIGNSLTVQGVANADSINFTLNGKKVGTVELDGQLFSKELSVPSDITGGEMTLRADTIVGGKVVKSAEKTILLNPERASLTDLSLLGTLKKNVSDHSSLTIGSIDVMRGVELTAPASGADPRESGFTVSIAGAGYRYYEGFASLNYYASQPSAKAVFCLFADGTEIYRSNEVSLGNAAYIRADIPAGTRELRFAALSADGSKQTVTFGDGMLCKSKGSLDEIRLPMTEGEGTSTLPLNGIYQQISVSGSFTGITLQLEGVGKGDLLTTVYPFVRSPFRSQQETAAASTYLCYEQAEKGSYYIHFAEPLPAGEYLITFACSDSVKARVSESGPLAYYTATDAKKGAICGEVVLADQGALGSCTPKALTGASLPNQATKAEKERAEKTYRGYMKNLATLPVSFSIGSEAHRGFDDSFEKVSQTTEVNKDNEKIETTVTVMRHKPSGLLFTVKSDFYPDYAAYEWVMYIKNEGNATSPIVSSLYALDLTVEGKDPFIHTSYGDSRQFLPDDRALDGKITFDPDGGRSTQGAFPYYNLEYGDSGLLMAIGWSGQWQCIFDNTADADKTNIKVKQQTFRSTLKAGEEVRTPLVAMVFYDGCDLDRAANLWRHWFIDCSMHRVVDEKTGELSLMAPGVSGGTSVQFNEMTQATDRNQIEAIRQYIENGIDISYWWMDAGWYYDTEGKPLGTGNWTPTGSWQVDKGRFPSLMADISDYGASVGVKTLLWFEPERVGGRVMNDGSTVKSSWILADYLVNEGNLEARDWIVNRILEVMGKGKISLYREDFNCQPLDAWNAGDQKQGANRAGITENLYVQGHLYIWDRILEAYPSVMIDSCASGGYRNDLEALRRSIQLHKTDYDYGDSSAQQMYALQMYDWMPYFGTKADTFGATGYADRYFLRTALVSWTVLGYDSNKPIDWDIVRDVVDEHKLVDRYNYADYYKLTSYSRDDSDPVAWQFYDPADKSGYALVFRRPDAPAKTHLRLKGLDADTTYHLWLEDRSTHYEMTGKELMTSGIDVIIPAARSSDILHISTKYEERRLTPSITQVSSGGTWAGAIAEKQGWCEIDIRFNMALRGTVFTDSENLEDGVIGDYLDTILIGGKTLGEITQGGSKVARAEYDAINNILKLYIKTGTAGVSTKNDISIVVKKELANHEGISVGKDIEFTYRASDEAWYKMGTAVSGIELRTQSTAVKTGERILLTALVTPDDATYRKVNFTVSDDSIAVIDENGYLRGRKPGTVTVTATAKDHSDISATIQITVLDENGEPLPETNPPETHPSDAPSTDAQTGENPASGGGFENALPLILVIVGGAMAVTALIVMIRGSRKVRIICLCVIGAVVILLAIALPLLLLGTEQPDAPVQSTEPIETPVPETEPPKKTGEKLLVDMRYTDYRLNGSDQPFYHEIPHSGEQFDVSGVRYQNGIFINPVDNATPGYVTYDISGYDYDRFAFRFGKLDVAHGSGSATYAVVYIDGEEVARTKSRSQGDSATLCTVEIPEGAQELKIECYTTGTYPSCSSVLGDARLYYEGTELEWP